MAVAVAAAVAAAATAVANFSRQCGVEIAIRAAPTLQACTVTRPFTNATQLST
jgi:hypothetical protein